jgi:hypothetical protein
MRRYEPPEAPKRPGELDDDDPGRGIVGLDPYAVPPPIEQITMAYAEEHRKKVVAAIDARVVWDRAKRQLAAEGSLPETKAESPH